MPPPAPHYLEIATFSPHSALTAINHGAHRIELCAGPYSSGGLTPPASDLALLRSLLRTTTSTNSRPPPPPIFVMVRPRANDFSVPYTNPEIEEMIHAIHELKAAGADGFVFGLLRPGPGPGPSSTSQSPSSLTSPPPECEAGVRVRMEIDVPGTHRLVQAASPLPCTFHRAFDQCLPSAPDDEVQSVRKAVDDVVATGCRAMLTSGGSEGSGGAPRNVGRLTEIARLAEGKVEVIIGGGVRSGNLSGLMESLRGEGVDGGKVEGVKVRWWHSSARTDVDVSEEKGVNGGEVERMVRILRGIK